MNKKINCLIICFLIMTSFVHAWSRSTMNALLKEYNCRELAGSMFDYDVLASDKDGNLYYFSESYRGKMRVYKESEKLKEIGNIFNACDYNTILEKNGYRVIKGEIKYYTHGDGRDYFYVVKTPRGGIYRLDYFGEENEPL